MTPPSTLPRPAALQALWPVAAVRAALTLTSIVGSATLVPATWRRSEHRIAARTGRPTPAGLQNLGGVLAVVVVVVSLAWFVLWVVSVRGTLRGRRWGAVLLGVLSAYGVVSGLFGVALAAVTSHLPFDPGVTVPGWIRGVGIAVVIVDAVVVALLLRPASRAWVRAMNPPARPASPPTGWHLPPGPRH